MVRISLTGDDLAQFGWNGPAAHIKLIFPEEGQTEPSLPQPGEPRPTRIRTYTPRRFDPAIPELDVDFVLHGDGPASQWAAQAQIGQKLALAGPGPNYQLDPDAAWYLLVGDDAALPAIETILEVLPPTTQAYVLLEVADTQEERTLQSPASFKVSWLHPSTSSTQPNTSLEQALRDFELPAGAGRIYVGCEAGAIRRMRQFLLTERGFDASKLVTRGYWKFGNTDYTDHDYGTD
jgi:NADPH-dependent ferric siderophore reductase